MHKWSFGLLITAFVCLGEAARAETVDIGRIDPPAAAHPADVAVMGLTTGMPMADAKRYLNELGFKDDYQGGSEMSAVCFSNRCAKIPNGPVLVDDSMYRDHYVFTRGSDFVWLYVTPPFAGDRVLAIDLVEHYQDNREFPEFVIIASADLGRKRQPARYWDFTDGRKIVCWEYRDGQNIEVPEDYKNACQKAFEADGKMDERVDLFTTFTYDPNRRSTRYFMFDKRLGREIWSYAKEKLATR